MRQADCIFCDTKINANLYVCSRHTGELVYSKEEWFRELVTMRNRQNTINGWECSELDESLEGTHITPVDTSFRDNLISAEYEYSGKTQSTLAEKHGVSQVTIGKIVKAQREKYR